MNKEHFFLQIIVSVIQKQSYLHGNKSSWGLLVSKDLGFCIFFNLLRFIPDLYIRENRDTAR